MYVLPEPRSMEYQFGRYRVCYHGTIYLAEGTEPEDYRSASLLKKELQEQLGFFWEIEKGSAAKGAAAKKNLKQACIVLQKKEETEKEKPEGYRLQINQQGIFITGESSAGLWYGVQTLRQMLRQEDAILPCLEIEDEPALPNRGFYHDATRGRIPKMEELKQMVDHLAFYKINQLQLYIEHSFLFPDFSEVWRDDTPLTAEDILELDRYCKERYIDLVPSIASFGHLYKVLRTRQYAGLCELPDAEKEPFSFPGRMAHHTIDVTQEESFELVKKMIEDFMPLFTSRYFNVCADETFDLGKGKSKEEGERIGREGLYVSFLKRICALVAEHGRIPMFWGDIICEFPDAIKELPEGTICLNWGYSPKQSAEDTKKFQEVGAIQYVCPGVQGWNSLVNDMKGAYENISRMCRYAHEYGAVGVLNTDWGDYGHINHPEFSTTGMIYGAAFSWNPHIPSRGEINPAIAKVEYEDSRGWFVDTISGLYECSIFSWYFMVAYKERCQGRAGLEAEHYDIKNVRWEALADAEDQLSERELELYEEMTCMEERGRKRVYAYLLAAEGIRLFNQIGKIVGGLEEGGQIDKNALASSLEHWYRRYRLLWYTVSRESELYRIGEVISWYGDYLRSDIK